MLSDEDSLDSDLDVNTEIWNSLEVKEFTSQIIQYKIETDLDRKLLLGVLVRDYHLNHGSARLPVPRSTVARHSASSTEIQIQDISILENSQDHVQLERM